VTVTSNVPEPTFGDQGFVAPAEAEILAGVTADINTDFGGGLNPGLTTPQGQLASTETAIIGDKNAQFIWYTNQVDPAFNSGRMQDAIGRIYYMTRIPGAPTVVQATCSGLDGVIIPLGAIAQATDGNLYIAQQQGTITGGSVILPFACGVNGPIDCPAGSLNAIYQAITGWESITNPDDGVLGINVETPSQFEARRSASVAVNAIGILDAILGAVLAVPNVLDAFVAENDNGTPQTIGGKILGPNSLYVCVLGGESQAIGNAIWSRKAPGCGYNGNTTVTVVDPAPEYLPPIPSYSVTFQRPTIIDFAMLVVLKNNNGIPANALALIQNVIINAFAGTDGGPRAKIGSTVFASRYYAPVAMLGSWAQIVEIQLGVNGIAAGFTGSITGSTLTVTGVSYGSLAVGQLLQDAGLLLTGTTITAFGTGTGGAGTYTVSRAQTVPSESMSATGLVNDLTMNIDEAPAISAPNIQLALQ
jgi:hypothetical protein